MRLYADGLRARTGDCRRYLSPLSWDDRARAFCARLPRRTLVRGQEHGRRNARRDLAFEGLPRISASRIPRPHAEPLANPTPSSRMAIVTLPSAWFAMRTKISPDRPLGYACL